MRNHRRRPRPSLPQEPVLFAPAPRSNASPTSVAAAAELAARPRKLAGMRLRIHRWLIERGPCGATHEEISNGTGIRLDTVKPRVHELGEMGLVKALKVPRNGRLVFIDQFNDLGRALEPWPIPRPDWRARALAAERRNATLEQELGVLLAQTNPTPTSGAAR